MKIAVTADLHLNKTVYKSIMDRTLINLPFRNVDFMNSFRYIVDECVKIGPDMLVIGGDIYDHYEPSNEIRGFFSNELSKLINAKIPVIILTGNHDICKKHHALKDIQELKLKNIMVVDTPMILNLKGMQFLLFPYSLDIEQQKKTIKEEFNDFIERVQKERKPELPSMFFGHFGVKNATINQYNEDTDEDEITNTTTTTIEVLSKKITKDFKNRNDNDIDPADLDRLNVDYVVLGDFHKHQILDTKKCIAMYTGSIEKTSFSEVQQQKGFVLYDSDMETDSKMGKFRFIEYPNCRPMLEMKGNMVEIKDIFKKVDYSKYQEAIVKLVFTGTSLELVDFSSDLENFKKEIREKLNPIHIDFINKCNNTEQEVKATKLEKEIMSKGHLSNDDVVEVVKEIIKERLTDEQDIQLAINLADEIYKETIVK